MSVLAFTAYQGESRAAGSATSNAVAVPDAQPEAQQNEPETIPRLPGSTQWDPPPPAASPSTEVPPTPVEQRPPPASGVASKPIEVVPAPSSTSAPSPSGPPPLTWFGLTLYGVVDVGLAHLSHGAPASNTYGPGLPYIVQNYSNSSMTSVAGNGLSQSKLGLSAVEPLGALDLKAVFKLET
ncbi:MAG TPA: hypothetical protein VF524_14555, partial [Polyangia bacterium]